MSQYQNMKMQCQQYVNQAVSVEVENKQNYSGIVEHVDDQYVYLMVPINELGQYMDLSQLTQGTKAHSMYQQGHEYDHAFAHYPQPSMAREEDERFYPAGFYPPIFPYPYFPPYPHFPYPYGPYPRPIGWNRLILPLAALTAIAALY
ncbi:hypothetical protein N0O92_17630 [Alkalihalobacillus sp. MEB130]|uniref:hypothetical protein n=1 Tax=Alkalihalobacillus sp. MEB130 TaxID=2976704 RepID=UPI0028DDAADF|nr:hypothetical protein [Alkalihalobacillus sp. MEB130]MDT8862034.1 hypothetical protein [Alkalihalobacillus sp. MEB130]